MSRKKIIVSIVVGAALAGTAFYFLKTKSGKKELQRIKDTGKATADVFDKLGEEVARNVDQARKEERNKALKNLVQEVWTEA